MAFAAMTEEAMKGGRQARAKVKELAGGGPALEAHGVATKAYPGPGKPSLTLSISQMHDLEGVRPTPERARGQSASRIRQTPSHVGSERRGVAWWVDRPRR